MIKKLLAIFTLSIVGTLGSALLPPIESQAAGRRNCHVHVTPPPAGPDTYVWARYGRRCRFNIDPPAILIEYDYPDDWGRRRVIRRCNRIGADFSPVSHHGRNCYRRDY